MSTLSAESASTAQRRARLADLLAERSARRGTFTLASGRTSDLYIDARLTTMSPDGLALIGPLGLDLLAESGWLVDAVGGLTLGADPIAYAVAYASTVARGAGEWVRAFTVRKQPKAHGTGQRIEGPFRSSDRVAVVEDVITTGGSALQAVEAVRAAGGVVVGVLAIVDREEGGREAIEQAAGVPVLSLVRAAEVVGRLSLPG
ncbi:orotate phosphoribosyltransferase [Gemmatimonadetes bacterium T265]|nr:orotate phosphoribosyltransferase [Gemmatimonadetes bacterium T265]